MLDVLCVKANQIRRKPLIRTIAKSSWNLNIGVIFKALSFPYNQKNTNLQFFYLRIKLSFLLQNNYILYIFSYRNIQLDAAYICLISLIEEALFN